MKKLTIICCLFLFPFLSFSQTDYLGQWQSIDSNLLVEFTSDSVFIYDIDSSGCYELNALSYTDPGVNNTLYINGAIPAYYNFISDTFGIDIPQIGTYTLLSHTFDIAQYEPCGGDSTSNPQYTYMGQWSASDSIPTYVHFTSDSILLYRFDSSQCYTYNSLVYSDIGNNQLQIAVVLTSSYSFANNGNTMSINITGVGDLELQKDTFDASTWLECTWEWQCTQTGCENVGNGNGIFNTQIDCQTVCVDTTSISEHLDLGVLIYPNPFYEYTTLSFNSSVTSYQLYDFMGRLILEEELKVKIKHLHRNNLKSGLYILRLLNENSLRDEKLLKK